MPAAQGKKELLEALHAIAPIAFLSERKLAGITHLLPSYPLPVSPTSSRLTLCRYPPPPPIYPSALIPPRAVTKP